MADCELKGIPIEDCDLVQKVQTDFLQSNKCAIVLVVFCFALSNFIRAIRWQQLLTPLGYQVNFLNSYAAVNIGYLLNLSFPRAGEIARPGVLAKYENVNFEHAIGTVVTERLVDFLCLFAALVLGLILAGNTLIDYFNEHFDLYDKLAPFLKNKTLLLSIIVVLALVLFYILKNLENIKTTTWGQKILNFITGLIEGIKSIRQVRNPILFIIYSISIWVLYYLMTYFMFDALDSTKHLTPLAGLVVFLFGSMGMIFPSPGGLGSYHLMIEQALLIFGISISNAFSFANIIFFSVQIFGVILIGIISYIYLPIINKGND